MLFRTYRHFNITRTATELTTYPISFLSWNIDQERPSQSTRLEKEKRLEKLIESLNKVHNVDFITVQESSKKAAEAIVKGTNYSWLAEAQARTYNGYLQVFHKKESQWSARVAWQYTGLTFEVWPTELQPLVGENPWNIEGAALKQIHSPVIRISNIHLDGSQINHSMRSSAINYYTKVPKSDIIIGDGQYRSEDVFPPNYADAYDMAGNPAGARYTHDTYENQYFTHHSANYSRSTRAYVRQSVVETSLAPEKDPDYSEERPAYKIHATEMKVLKPWVSENSPRVSVSDHYGLLVRFKVEI